MKYLFLLILSISCSLSFVSAQTPADSAFRVRRDSIRTSDSIFRIQKTKDSLLAKSRELISIAADSVRKVVAAKRKMIIASVQATIAQQPYFGFTGTPLRQSFEIRNKQSDESIFYFIVGLVLYIALMRLFFYKYMITLFTLFFRATLRQQQLREQLLQAPLPALLMNIFFVVSVSTYCAFLADYYQISDPGHFWRTFLYAVVLISGIYLVKFIFLNVVGWIFGLGNVTDTYIFVVFLINKMVGIFLLPFIAMLAFPTQMLLPVVLMMSYILIAGMLFYRFIISFRPVRTEIKLNRLHFFLYLCAFEIAPLLLIYKVLLTFVKQGA